MIRVHKWLILALPILPATPAIAQHTNEVWLPGNGKACQTVCQTGGRLAVDSGPYKQSNLFYVCATNTQGEGFRPGFNLQINPRVPASTCTVGYGEKAEVSGEYTCLCAVCINGPANCPY
jgi:hypothetical protein